MRRFWFFDLDGTLADTEADIKSSWRKVIVELGLDQDRFDRLYVTGPAIDEVIRTLYPERYSDELVAEIRRRFSSHYDTEGFPLTREYPGMLAEVRRIRAAGAKVFIVTNKRYVAMRLMAAHFGWDKVFDGLYAGDMHKDDSIGKLRKPQLLALIMGDLKAGKADCVMVGDTKNDFEAARENGILSIGVSWGYGSADELKMADVVIERPELPDCFSSLISRGGI